MREPLPRPYPLLMYGRDVRLLDLRCLVLRVAGFVVHATMALPEIQARLAADPTYGLLIVCHTASADDRRALAAMAEDAAVPVYQIEALITPDILIAQASAAISHGDI